MLVDGVQPLLVASHIYGHGSVARHLRLDAHRLTPAAAAALVVLQVSVGGGNARVVAVRGRVVARHLFAILTLALGSLVAAHGRVQLGDRLGPAPDHQVLTSLRGRATHDGWK